MTGNDVGRSVPEMQAPSQEKLSAPEQIAQNHSVNDAFIDNIRAKLDMLDQIWNMKASKDDIEWESWDS